MCFARLRIGNGRPMLQLQVPARVKHQKEATNRNENARVPPRVLPRARRGIFSWGPKIFANRKRWDVLFLPCLFVGEPLGFAALCLLGTFTPSFQTPRTIEAHQRLFVRARFVLLSISRWRLSKGRARSRRNPTNRTEQNSNSPQASSTFFFPLF
jgi:hypothetical protein